MSSFLGMDAVVMDVDECSKSSSTDTQARPRKVQKRKRGCMEIVSLEKEEREARIEGIQKEIDSLFKYYDEVKCQKVDLDLGLCSSSNSVVAALMEESELSLSKLVDEIFEKMRKIDNGGVLETVTVASVKASVLFVGRRVMYGVPNADADVLEDVSKECLWCWEVPLYPFRSLYLTAFLEILCQVWFRWLNFSIYVLSYFPVLHADLPY